MRNKNSPPFIAFLKDASNREVVQIVAVSNGWSEGCVHYGDVRQAIVYLKEQPSPKILLIEVGSAQEAPELLDRLADVCPPTTQVIVTSTVNEYSFFSWLKSIGIEHYLLAPFNGEALREIIISSEPKTAPTENSTGTVIALMGTRGGVGATTIATSLATLLAKEYKQQTALLDMDAYFGSVAMAFNLQPGQGLRDALEKPDRIDGLFLDRVMLRQSEHLAILSAEERLQEMVGSTAAAAENLLGELRQKYRFVVIDLPRMLTPLTRSLLAQADETILVSERSLLSLRDLLRLRDYIHDELHKPEPLVVCNREGLSAKHEIKRKDFDTHYGRPVEFHIPCMAEAFAATRNGEMLVEVAVGNTEALEPLHRLARHFLKGSEMPEENTPENSLLKLFKGYSHVWKTRHTGA